MQGYPKTMLARLPLFTDMCKFEMACLFEYAGCPVFCTELGAQNAAEGNLNLDDPTIQSHSNCISVRMLRLSGKCVLALCKDPSLRGAQVDEGVSEVYTVNTAQNNRWTVLIRDPVSFFYVAGARMVPGL